MWMTSITSGTRVDATNCAHVTAIVVKRPLVHLSLPPTFTHTTATTMASLAKLTSISTQTLSLLLERQRLQTLSDSTSNHSLHLPQITRNLKQLKAGILALEEKEKENGRTEAGAEAVRLLKSQYERMRGMLGVDVPGVERYVCFVGS